MVEWFKHNKFLIGIVIACLMMGTVAYTYQQKSSVDAKQNEQLTALLNQSQVQQDQKINQILSDVADRAYSMCLQGNTNRQIVKDALNQLGSVAAQVPLSSYDGSDPIDREAVAKAFAALDQLQPNDCVREEVPDIDSTQ